jgi:hypothetical protein
MSETISGSDLAARRAFLIDCARNVVDNPGNQASLDALAEAFNGPTGWDTPGLFTRSTSIPDQEEVWAYSGMLGGQPQSQQEAFLYQAPTEIAEDYLLHTWTLTITQWNAEITFTP